ncbi:MAG: diacylglycerol/polyprenol kinase family protein [Nanoarchaeota archaeon]
MRWEFKKELGRKLVHLTSILILVIYIGVGRYSHRLALLTLTFILVILLEFEYFRIEHTKKTRIMQYLSKFRRKKEKAHMGGEIFFLIGAILCLAIFDFRIAAAAILMETFGDMIAALVGKKFGRHKIFNLQKSWEGTIAELCVNILIGWLLIRNTLDNSVWFLYTTQPLGNPIWPIIMVMAVTATVTEVVINKLDDNLLVPLFSGFNGQIILLALSIQIIPL